MYHVKRNIGVWTICKQNEAIYKKKELQFALFLWPIEQRLIKELGQSINQSINLTQVIGAIH